MKTLKIIGLAFSLLLFSCQGSSKDSVDSQNVSSEVVFEDGLTLKYLNAKVFKGSKNHCYGCATYKCIEGGKRYDVGSMIVIGNSCKIKVWAGICPDFVKAEDDSKWELVGDCKKC
ncbi:MAG: hypothetical protein IH946_00930 [Bacteroidetes bacterium]|nr:hypothetical protein [Bacteroidota bacterium]